MPETIQRRSPADAQLVLQAKRHLMDTYGWTEPMAFAVMRTAAMHQHRPMALVAKDVLASPEPAAALRLLPGERGEGKL